VSDQADDQQAAYLERVNAILANSLQLCHVIVDDYRTKLAANSNDPPFMLSQSGQEEDNGRTG
jgi:hypothetical protein